VRPEKASVERVCPGAEGRRLLHRIVPEATLKRRQERLSAEEPERAERLARVYATALLRPGEPQPVLWDRRPFERPTGPG
jgi:uncharacterized protein (DUF2384 family)